MCERALILSFDTVKDRCVVKLFTYSVKPLSWLFLLTLIKDDSMMENIEVVLLKETIFE